MSPAATVLL
jgi:hypothetical protein